MPEIIDDPQPGAAPQLVTLTSTVKDAKDWLRSRLREGDSCPVCDQRVQMYRRKITSTMARGLIIFHRYPDGEWFHLQTLHPQGGGGDDGKLAYWNLIEEEKATRPDGGRTGYWRVTPEGHAFARGELTVDKYALVYNGRCLAWEGEPVTIQDALGTKFRLDELLAGR